MAKKLNHLSDVPHRPTTAGDRTAIAVELDEAEYARLVAMAERRGLGVPALLDAIIAAELRRLRALH